MEGTELDKIAGWFAGRLPDGWFSGAPSVTTDDKQVVVVGTLSEPVTPEGASADFKSAAESGRIQRFREATRAYRIAIAREAERQFKLPVTWGATSGGTSVTFTPGGSGRRESGEGGDEAKKVMIFGRRGVVRAWRRRYGFGGPRAFRRRPTSGGDVQSF
jgi:hypothetical protein